MPPGRGEGRRLPGVWLKEVARLGPAAGHGCWGGSGGWEEDVCFGGGEETILRVMGRSLLQMGSRDHSELEAGVSLWGG